jgi:perosamine synthetase
MKKINWPIWPRYSEEHESAVLRVIRSNQIFAAKEVARFESDFSRYTGSRFSIGVGNATQGLHLALAAFGVGIGDEVIVTPYSWISSASCVLMQGAIPIFVDIESTSFGICPKKFEESITEQTKAIILVHMFGFASKALEIKEICKRRNIAFIEDASHAHGASLGGQKLGTFGDVGVFSLHQRKAISTGDGGVICTDNSELYELLRRLRSFGAERLSYNYRMTEFAGVLGQVGLKRLDEENEVRRNNHQILRNEISSSEIRLIEASEDVEPVYYANLLEITLPVAKQEIVLVKANEAGVPLKRTWQPLNKHPHFRRENMPNGIAPWDFAKRSFIEPHKLSLKNSEIYQTSRLFELECHPLVTKSDIAYAANTLQIIIENEC